MLLVNDTLANELQAAYALGGYTIASWLPCGGIHRMLLTVAPRPEDTEIFLVLLNHPFTDFGFYTLTSFTDTVMIISDVGAGYIGSDLWAKTAPDKCK